MKTTPKKPEPQHIVALYTEARLTTRQIASIAGVSHTTIHRILQKHSMPSQDTLTLTCQWCERTFTRHRSKARSRGPAYCSRGCFAEARLSYPASWDYEVKAALPDTH